MKRALFVLLLFCSLNAAASTITIGLTSENVFAWNIWEYREGRLTHYLLLHNKDSVSREVEVKLKKFEPDGTAFDEIPTDVVFHKTILKAGEVAKLTYPSPGEQLDFMEFFENQKRIGVLLISADKPDKSFINKKYGYYTNESINSGPLGYWVRFTSIFDPNAKITLKHISYNKKDSRLLKFFKPEQDLDFSELSALKPTDKTILELSNKRRKISMQLAEKPEADKLIIIFIYSNYLENGRTINMGADKIGVFRRK